MPRAQLQTSEIVKFHQFLDVLIGVLILEGCVVCFIYFRGLSPVYSLSAWLITCCLWLFGYLKAKFNFEHIGIHNAQIIGAKLNEEERDRLWEKKSLSVYEWNRLCNSVGLTNSLLPKYLSITVVFLCVAISIATLIVLLH